MCQASAGEAFPAGGCRVPGDELREAARSYEGKRIVVTGGTGYLGTNLVSLLQNVDCRIVRVTRGGRPSPIRGATAEIDEVTADVREPGAWERILEGKDIVFHLAAQTSTYVANEDPPADLASNVMPMVHLLETCRKRGWRPIVVFASTVTVAGIPRYLPVDETHPDNPVTVYDLHKLMAESYLRYYAEQGIVRGVILRLSNVYGPGPRSQRPDRGVLNQMIRRALAGDSLTVYGRGDQVRDYIFAEDVGCAFLEAARCIDAVHGRYFVIGSGQGHTIAETLTLVAERVALKTGVRATVMHVDPPSPQSPIEARSFVADWRRFSQATGWRPRYSLAEGIDRTIEALR